jgi:hypothetical protein
MEKIAISSKDLEKLVINPAIKNKVLHVGNITEGEALLRQHKNNYEALKDFIRLSKKKNMSPSYINELNLGKKQLKAMINQARLDAKMNNKKIMGGIGLRNSDMPKELNMEHLPIAIRSKISNAIGQEPIPKTGRDFSNYLVSKRPGTAFLSNNPIKDLRTTALNGSKKQLKAYDRVLADKKESRAFNNLVGAHELEELDRAKKLSGVKWSHHKDVSGSSHIGLQSIGDIQRVRSMPRNDSPLAQNAFRTMREREIDAMIDHAPGLSPILREHSSFRNMDFDKNIKRIVEHNKNHNDLLEHFMRDKSETYKNYVRNKRFLPTDYDQVYNQHKQIVEPRINRHMKRHIGNVLDNSAAIKQLEARDKQNLLPTSSSI